MSKYFTRTGDDGLTGLLGEGRIPKYDPRIEAVGALDETTSALGMARALCQAPPSAALLLAIQRDIYHLMAEVSATPENAARFRSIDAARVAWLEQQTDALGQSITLPKEFIVPGDTPAGAAVDLARTVVRRAERRLALLMHDGQVENTNLLHYINRLSSLLYVLELLENQITSPNAPTLARTPK